jgi:hypothetical protein
MKKNFLFCVLIFLINLTANCQVIQTEIRNFETQGISGEKIRLFTDRQIYCVSEKIYFTTEYSCVKELDSIAWSNILYVELIKWNGGKIAQEKLKLTIPATSGSIKIPGNTLSGCYYLRAYTKWLRNFPASGYSYQLVKIVNPFVRETDGGPAEKPALTASFVVSSEQNNAVNNIKCTTDKNEYKSREKVEIGFSLNDIEFIECDRYCISVAKAGSIDTTNHFCIPESNFSDPTLNEIEYLPEIRGITISGKVVDKITKLPRQDIFLNLSELQQGEYFSVYKTNAKGQFVFSLPDMQGKHDFFIQTEPGDSSLSEILIDNGFCNQPLKLPYIAFSLNENERQSVKEMAVNLQLNEKYLLKADTIPEAHSVKLEPLPFYGSKKVVYFIKKYIELPDIGEFINELVMDAGIIFDKEEASSISIKRNDFLYHPPLVLMDNIQVNNDKQLLKIPLSKIEKVEVISKDYVVHNMVYNGIISFYSKNKDYAGIALNKNSVFFSYDLLSDNNGFANTIKPEDSRIPDRKNILYWNPDIQLSADNSTKISFYTSDNKGDYMVYIRGKNSDNNREIYGKCYFSVK